MRTCPPITVRGNLFDSNSKTRQQQAVFNPFRPQQAVQRDRVLAHETQKGRVDQSGRVDSGPQKGSISHEYPPEVHYSPTLRPVANPKTMSANAKEGVSPEIASNVANTPGLVLDNKESVWDANHFDFHKDIDAPIPPEVTPADESRALRVPEREASTNLWGALRPNVKRKSADEEQPGTGATTKRLRGT